MATPAGTIDISARFDSSGLERDVLAALRRIETKSTISLNTRNFTQPLGKITGLANEFNKSLEASNARVVAFGASAGIIFNIQKAFSSLIKSTIEVEKSLTDINVVLNLSTKGIASFGDQLFDVAKNTGSAFQEVTSAAVEFSRQGLGLEQTLKRTRDALILTRLSGLDVVSSTEALTSAVNSFTKEALTTTDVVNKLAAVDARFAVSSADLSEAIKRVGSSASEAGVSFDELLGIVTSVQQTTARGGAVIGNALKTIFTRIERPEVINDLREFGIAVTDASGNILPTIKVIENLAQSFQSLNPVVKSQVAELVGGVYQINILKAALADVSKENSVFASATSTATKAVDEAILKNEALNKSLSALLNSTTANLTQLASKIGGVSVAPAVRKVLGTINDELTDVNDKPAESVGAKIASGLLAGLTNFITGPGIGIGTLVVGKLLGNFTKFATDATKNFLGLNTVGQQQKVIQDETANILARNPQLIQGIISGSKSRLQVEKEIKQILMEQAALSEQIALSSRGMAERMVATGLSVTSTGGLRRSAGGFIPAKDRAAEVMGAAAGGYVAGNVIKAPDSIGGIMNSAESVKYVPGFAQPFILPPKGSKAASNLRNKSLKQVGIDPYLAKGFIPNFVSEEQTLRAKNPQTMGPTLEGWYALLQAKNPKYVGKYFSANFTPGLSASEFLKKTQGAPIALNSFSDHLQALGKSDEEIKTIINSALQNSGLKPTFLGRGKATLQSSVEKEKSAMPAFIPDAEMLVWRSNTSQSPYFSNPTKETGSKPPISFKIIPLDQSKISANKIDIQKEAKDLSYNALNTFARSLPLSSAGQASITDAKLTEYGERTPLAYRQLAGTIFEAGINLVSDYIRDTKQGGADFDIRGGANIGNLRNFFPAFTSNLGDYKLSDSEDNKVSFLEKINKEFGGEMVNYFKAQNAIRVQATTKESIAQSVEQRITEAGSKMAALEQTKGIREVAASSIPRNFSAGFIPNFAGESKQTSSPEFKRWFENSKAVNEQGEPLRVYHGTNASFTTFRQAKEGTYGKGIYVTPDLEMASDYTTESALGERRGQGGNIMPLYTSLKNPIEVVDGKGSIGPVEVLKKLGYTSDKASDIFEKALESKGNLTTQIQKRAELYGHDGIIARYPDGRIKEIVVFRPEQVKSSIGNKGTFNPINPDIRYANGFIPNFAKQNRQTSSPAFKRWFAGSKVVDEKGKYLRVYHGSRSAKDFSTFRTETGHNFGPGAYFTPEPIRASGYAGDAEGARVYPAYLNLKNPYLVESDASITDLGYKLRQDPANDALIKRVLARYGSNDPNILGNAEIGNAWLREQGYDGIIKQRNRYTENGFVPEIVETVAFKPEQIKSAIGNRGTFDASSKDIRYANGFIPNFANNLDYNPNFLVGSGSDAIFLSAYDQLSGEFGGGPAYPEVVQGRSFATTSTGSLNTLNQNAMSIIRGGGKAFFSPVVNSNALESLGGNKFFLMALAKRYPRFSNFRLAREILKSPAGTFKISEIRGATNQIISNIQKNYGRNKGILRAREVAESISDKRFLNPQYKNLSTSLITEIVSNQGSIVAPNSGHSLYNLAALGGTSKMSNPVQYQKIFEGLIDKDRLSGLRNSYIPIGRRFNLGDDFSKTLGLASGFIPNFATGFNLSTIRFLMKAGGKLSGSVLSPKTLINFASGKGKLEDVIDPFISFLKKPADVIRSEQDLNDAKSLIKIIFANPTAREKIARKLAPIISETSFAVDSQVRAIEGLNPDKNDDNQPYEQFLRYRLLGGQAEYEDFNEDGTKQTLKKNKDGSYRFNPNNSAGRGELFGIFHTTRALFAEDSRDTFKKSENDRKGAKKLGPEENVAGPNPFLGYTYKLGRFIGNLGKKRKAIKYEDRWDVELHDREREILKEYLKKAAIETSQFSFSKAEAFDRIQQEFKEGSYGGNIDSLILRELLSSIPNSKPVVLKGIHRIPKDLRFFKGFIPNFNSSADIQKYLADFDSRTVSEFSNKNIRGGTGMSVLLERLKFVKGLLNINPNLTAKELIEILNDRKAKGNNINFTGQSRRFTREDAKRLIARVKNNRDDLGMFSGFIPNFNPVEKAVGREMGAGYSRSQVRIGQDKRLQTYDNPFALGIYNTDEGSLAEGIRLAQQAGINPKTKGKSEGHIPNFADFGTTDTVILFSSLTLLASQVKNLVVDFRQLSDATKKAVQNQKDITAASTANISKINKQFTRTEASIQTQAKIFANIDKNLKTTSKGPLEVYDPASGPSGRRLATADEIKQLEELRAQRSQARLQRAQGTARERQSIQEAQQSAQSALKNRFGRYTTTLGPTAGIIGSQLANVVGSFLPESDIKGKAVASGIGDIASFAGTGAAFGAPGLIVGTLAGIASAFIKIKDAKADQAIFDIGKSLDQIKTKSAEFSSSAQGYAVSLEELQRALNDPQSRPEALSRFQKNLSDSLAAIPAEFRDKVFRAGTDLNKVTQAITDINKELSNTQRNLERELSIATLFKEKTTFFNKIGLSNFGLNERDQKLLDRLFASSLNQQEVLKNFSNAAPGQDFETFINDLASQAVSVRNLATAPIGGTVGFTPLNQAQTTTQQFLDPARLEQIKSELSRRGVLTEGVAGQLDTAFEKGNIESVKSIFKAIAEEGKSLIEAEKRTRLLVEIQKENINRIKDNEQALKNLNKQYNNLNLLLSNQIDLEKNRASTIREINLIQSEGKVSIQRARTKGLLDASAPFITEQQRLDIQGQLDINEITTRGNARIQQAANELLDSFTNILVTQSQDARQEIVGLVSDPTTRPQDITRQRNVFQQTIQKLNPLITQSLRDINSGKNIKDIQTDLIGQIRNFAEFSPEQQDVLIQSIESSGSKLENQLGLILAETNRDLAIQQAQLEAQKQTLDLTRKLSFAGGAQALATTGEAGISQLYDNLSQLVSEFRKTNAIGTVAQRGSTSFKLLDVLTNQLQLNRATQAPTPFESADAFNNQVSSDLTNLTAVSIAGRVQQIRKSLNLAQRLTEIQTGQPTAGTALGRAFETAGQEAITTAMDQITAEFKLGNMGTYLDALQNEARYLNTLTQQQNDLLAKTLPDNLNQNFQKVITSQVGSKLDDLTTALRTTINSLATQTQKGVLETEQSNLLPIAAPDVRKQILERVLNQTGLKETPPAVSITSKTDSEKIKKFNEEMADLNEYINSLAILKVNPNTINSEDFRSVNLVKLNATIEEQKKAIDTQVRVRNKYPNYFTGAKDAVNERLIEIRSLQKPAEEQVNKVTDLTGTYEGFVRSLNEEFGGRLLKGQEITVEQIKSLQANQKAMQELLQNPLQIMNVPTATNAYGPVEGAYAYGPNVVPAAQNQAGELNREIPDYLKTSRAATDRINQVLVARASITKDMSAVQEKVNKLLQQQTLDAEQQAELLKLQVELRKDVIEQDAKAADYLYNLYYSKDNRAFSDTFFREEKAAFADAEIRSQARSGNLALGAITQKNLEYTRIDFVKDTAEMIDEFQVNFKSGIGSAFGEAIKGTKSLQDAFRDMFQNLLNRMLDKSLQMGVDSLFAFGKAAAGFKNGGEIKKYNSGGMVTGGSGNKDDVLTMMRGGEFVIKKSSVNKYGSSYLEALNQQTIPTAADGGFAVGPLQNEFLYLNTPERPTSGEYAVDSRLSAMALTDENNPQNRLREQRFEELDRYLQDRAQFERDKDQAMKMYEKQVRSTFYSGLIAAGTQLASAGLNVGAQNLRLPKTGTTGIGKQYQAYSPDMPNYVGGKANGGFIPLKGFANGGMSSGGMPALLMGGEYVMNRDAVKNYGTDFMSRLNSGTLPRYAQGGSIGGSYTTSQTGPQSQSNSVDDLVTALNTLNENLTKTSNITQSEAGKAIGTVSQESGMSVVNNISISMTPAGEVNSQVQSNTTQGTTTSQNDQNSAQNNAKLAEILRAKVVEVLVEQKRPGGLLYRS